MEERCRDNPEIVREVASLLECDNSSDRFLETPAWRLNDELGNDPEECVVRQGTAIGSWNVVREICSGGMGTVCLGERTIDDDDQPLKQRAAIKSFEHGSMHNFLRDVSVESADTRAIGPSVHSPVSGRRDA